MTRSLLTAAMLLSACATGRGPSASAASAPGELRGEVTYRVRMALPEDAIIVVVFADVSRADAPMTVVARQEIRPAGRQVPIPFALAVDRTALGPGRRYVARATIESAGTLLLTTTRAYPVDPAAWPERLELVLEPVR